jgi:hypothetical protein
MVRRFAAKSRIITMVTDPILEYQTPQPPEPSPFLTLFRMLLASFFGLWGVWLAVQALGTALSRDPAFFGLIILMVAMFVVAVLVLRLPVRKRKGIGSRGE